MLIDEVESIWDAIAVADDWSAFNQKLADVRDMAAALAPGFEAIRSPSGEPGP
jgi:hypothetical protein